MFEIGWFSINVPIGIYISHIAKNYFEKKIQSLEKERASISDKRSRRIDEMIKAIKMVKLSAWEAVISTEIDAKRKDERSKFIKIFFYQALVQGISSLVPHFCGFSIFIMYQFINDVPLSLAKVFTVLTVFNGMLHPTKAFMMAVVNRAAGNSAGERLISIIKSRDIQSTHSKNALKIGEIKIKEASLSMGDSYHSSLFNDTSPRPKILSDLNLQINPGSFIGVIGEVGAGKSCLLRAILGEMVIDEGTVQSNGKIAYIPQESFLLNDTLRENIVFGEPFNNTKYNEIIKVCELGPDIDMLPGRDMTEIGERGINLSGGQKQRVSIARALYSDPEIYLFDDALSALDAEVSKKIFDNVLVGRIKNKTRILITHSTKFLDEFNSVAEINQGKIVNFDSIINLKKRKSSDFLKKLLKQVEHTEPIDQKQLPITQTKSELKTKGKLINAEGQEKGQIAISVYNYYFTKMGYKNIIICILFYIGYTACSLLVDYSVGKWGQAQSPEQQTNMMRIYCTLLVCVGILLSTRSYIYGVVSSNASYRIFKQVVDSLLRRPMQFYNTTETGVIMNRCSGDLESADVLIPKFGQIFMENLFLLGGTFIILIMISPIQVAPILIFIWFFKGSLITYMRKTIEFKRMSRLVNSPILSKLSEASSGVASIRAYKKEGYITERFTELSNMKATVDFHSKIGEEWLKIRVTYPLAMISLIALLSIALSKEYALLTTSDLTAMGMVFVYLISIGNQTGMIIWCTTTLMAEMSSIERLQEYAESTEFEDEWRKGNLTKEWPTNGNISIENLSARYDKDKPMIIHQLSLDVKSGQRIGIVGRTGCGKSTLFSVLTRLIEPTEQTKSILIDGVDIRTIGLHDLRENIIVISQDPIMLEGSLRYNIDPKSQFLDKDILAVLAKVELLQTLRLNNATDDGQELLQMGKSSSLLENTSSETMNSFLSYKVENGGSNLSMGQRQLISIARALILSPKILLMDEATSSIDSKTESVISSLLLSDFSKTTILSIAHRLDSLENFSEIIVMKEGRIIEQGHPDMLELKRGEFAKLKNTMI